MIRAGDLLRRIRGAGRTRRASAFLRFGAVASLFTAFSLSQGVAVPEGDRSLTIYHMHTHEQATVVFKRNGVYDPAGLAKLNYLVRDWRQKKTMTMDPHLYDLLWQVYQQSGSNEPIHIVCGYRSPETNAMLRRRSSAVAQHSQHMLGKAMDFFIPDVPLAKLRAIGLRMQVGGVGFYPTSGSPFVHMDTGSVRMWPRMTRQQLVQVFPNGKTLYVPSDGKPLPGYDEALAAYKARNGKPAVLVASADDEDDAGDVPVPRVSPLNPTEADVSPTRFAEVFARGSADLPMFRRTKPVLKPIPAAFFETAYDVSTPAVPADLATAMAARDQSVAVAASDEPAADPSASLPIAPTAVVATVDVTRPLRAEAITMAVLRKTNDAEEPGMPTLLAYAPMSEPAPAVPEKPRKASIAGLSIPTPTANPVRVQPDTTTTGAIMVDPSETYRRLPKADLTLTQLDTQGLRIWIADQSTREKRYALLTMPDFGEMPSLLEKPQATFAAGFTKVVYEGLRTDHFSGALVQPPAVVDLTMTATVAAR